MSVFNKSINKCNIKHKKQKVVKDNNNLSLEKNKSLEKERFNSLGYIRYRTYNIEEIHKLMRDCAENNVKHANRLVQLIRKHDKPNRQKIKYGNEIFNIGSTRLMTFYYSGTDCKMCGLKGKFYSLDNRDGSDKKHLNLIGINDKGEEVMLTSDHIIPKSKGGSDDISNRQTLCSCCNELKADKLEEELDKELNMLYKHIFNNESKVV